MRDVINIGVLALQVCHSLYECNSCAQGAFAEHVRVLQKLNGSSGHYCISEVRTVEELQNCDAIILPGGESTAMRIIGSNGGDKGMLVGFTVSILFQDYFRCSRQRSDLVCQRLGRVLDVFC